MIAKQEFKIEWSSLIVDIVKKKDLDCDYFKDCWEEDYNWTELDKFVIKNFRKLLISYGEVEAERINFKMTKKDLNKDLNIYIKNNLK